MYTVGGAKLMVLALSMIAMVETALIQATRSLWSMSRETPPPAASGRLRSTWKTPVFATAVVAFRSEAVAAVASFTKRPFRSPQCLTRIARRPRA